MDQFGYGYGQYDPATGQPFNPETYQPAVMPSGRQSSFNPFAPVTAVPGAAPYPSYSGNTDADSMYGSSLSPTQKKMAQISFDEMKGSRASQDPSYKDFLMKRIKQWEVTAEAQTNRSTVGAGTPDWLKSKFPADPKGTLMANARPMTADDMSLNRGGSLNFEPNPNYNRARGGITGLYDKPQDRYASFEKQPPEGAMMPEMRGPVSPQTTYTPEQTMTPSAQLDAISQKNAAQIAADRVKYAGNIEDRSYPTDLMGGETIPKELKVVPTSKMTPEQIAETQAGYQRVIDDARQPAGYRAKAKNLLARADAAYPEAVKAVTARNERIVKMQDKYRAGVDDMLKSNPSGAAAIIAEAERKYATQTGGLPLYSSEEKAALIAQAAASANTAIMEGRGLKARTETSEGRGPVSEQKSVAELRKDFANLKTKGKPVGFNEWAAYTPEELNGWIESTIGYDPATGTSDTGLDPAKVFVGYPFKTALQPGEKPPTQPNPLTTPTETPTMEPPAPPATNESPEAKFGKISKWAQRNKSKMRKYIEDGHNKGIFNDAEYKAMMRML